MFTDCFKQYSKAEKALLVQFHALNSIKHLRGLWSWRGGRSLPLSHPLDEVMEDEVYTICEKKGKGDVSISCHL